MKKAKLEYIITSVLVIVLIAFVIDGIKRVQRKQIKRKVTAKKILLKSEKAESGGLDTSMSLQEEMKKRGKSLKWKSDPFTLERVSVEAEEEAPTNLTLTGILWDEVEPLAIINEKIVKVGDKILGGNVTEITQNSVTIIKDQKEYKLWIKFPEIERMLK